MRSFLDAKLMAKTLETLMAETGQQVSHSRALEIVSQQFGYRNWNVLSAKINETATADGATFQRAIPVFRTFSEEKAREFYIDYLGFEVDWEHRFEPGMPLYMQIHRSDLIVHLSEHHGDATPGSCMFVEMTGIADFHAELAAKDYKYYHPALAQESWRVCFFVQDEFGNSLRFCEREAKLDSST